MELTEIMRILGNGIDETNILLVFAILDTVLGLSWRIKHRQALISKNFMSGVTRNFVPALLPALLYYMKKGINSTADVYGYAAFLIFITAGYFLIQSILSNLNNLGTPLPDWLKKWISSELKEKGITK